MSKYYKSKFSTINFSNVGIGSVLVMVRA